MERCLAPFASFPRISSIAPARVNHGRVRTSRRSGSRWSLLVLLRAAPAPLTVAGTAMTFDGGVLGAAGRKAVVGRWSTCTPQPGAHERGGG